MGKVYKLDFAGQVFEELPVEFDSNDIVTITGWPVGGTLTKTTV